MGRTGVEDLVGEPVAVLREHAPVLLHDVPVAPHDTRRIRPEVARATHVDGVLGLGPNAAGDADAASLAAAAEPTSSDHVGVPVRAAANQNVGGDKNGSGGGGGDR